MKSRFLILLLSWLWLLPAGPAAASANRPTGPWNMEALKAAPPVTWGERTGLVQAVYYEGEPLNGKPTRIFAYLGRPSGNGPFPAMVLVHGGGGKAFRAWAEHWAKRGYAALAMDTAGAGPIGRLPDGGPDQNDTSKFRNFNDANIREMWTYHAVAAAVRGCSLIASLPEVDPARIGLTGISWGGYLTCIIAGIDARFKVAVPVYGCGFLGDNSVWKNGALAALSPETRERWLQYFDPSQYLPGVTCPILFLNGSNDFAYPLDSYQKSYRLVPSKFRHVNVVLNLPHGHIWTFPEVDQFVDSVLASAAPLPRLDRIKVTKDSARASFASPAPLQRAYLNYTTDTGEWQKRQWQTIPAEIAPGKLSAKLPSARPLTCFFSATDQRDLRSSTEHIELPK